MFSIMTRFLNLPSEEEEMSLDWCGLVSVVITQIINLLITGQLLLLLKPLQNAINFVLIIPSAKTSFLEDLVLDIGATAQLLKLDALMHLMLLEIFTKNMTRLLRATVKLLSTS